MAPIRGARPVTRTPLHSRQTSLPRLTASLGTAPVIPLHGYEYFVHPITDGIPQVEPTLLEEALSGLRQRLPARFDKILTPEAMGIPLATGLALATGRPFTVARKRRYGLPGEIVVRQRTGYSQAKLHVHGLGRAERVVIVDDVVSTGGTIRALAEACGKAGADLVKVLVCVNKNVDLGALSREIGCPVEALVRLRVEGGRVHLEV